MKQFASWACFALAAAAVAGRFLAAPSGRLSEHGTYGDGPHLLKRDAPAQCRLDLFNALQKRGLLVDLDTGGNVTHIITARDMTLPDNPDDPASVGQFVMKETNNKDANDQELDPTQRRLHWRNSATGLDVNTAEFRAFEDKRFGYNLIGLAGCTAMVILSQRGIYIAHYWENIAFNQDDSTPGKIYETQNIAFYQTVTRGLVMGIDRQSDPVEQVSLKSVADQIDDDTIHGFLMIPRTGPSEVGVGPVDPYRFYWDKLKVEVAKILPKLDPKDKEKERWTEFQYDPVQKEEGEGAASPLWRTTRGRLLFKFDPDHQGKKKTLLIFESSIQADGSWEW